MSPQTENNVATRCTVKAPNGNTLHDRPLRKEIGSAAEFPGALFSTYFAKFSGCRSYALRAVAVGHPFGWRPTTCCLGGVSITLATK